MRENSSKAASVLDLAHVESLDEYANRLRREGDSGLKKKSSKFFSFRKSTKSGGEGI